MQFAKRNRVAPKARLVQLLLRSSSQISCGPMFELTRRRESKHPSPHQASCETGSRRSRPTICSTVRPLARSCDKRFARRFSVKNIKDSECRHVMQFVLDIEPADDIDFNFSVPIAPCKPFKYRSNTL